MTERGILKHFNSSTYRASVQLMGSTSTYLDNLKVARNIEIDEMVIGRHVYVTIPDDYPSNATDAANAVVVAVFDA